VALTYGWHLQQLDIQNAFLHEILDEEVFIRLPPGFEDTTKPDYLCHLDNALYGLKHAPQALHARISSILGCLGFTASTVDTSLFSLRRPGITLCLLVYVDDIIVVISYMVPLIALFISCTVHLLLRILASCTISLVLRFSVEW
jgi:hypothetical protein